MTKDLILSTSRVRRRRDARFSLLATAPAVPGSLPTVGSLVDTTTGGVSTITSPLAVNLFTDSSGTLNPKFTVNGWTPVPRSGATTIGQTQTATLGGVVQANAAQSSIEVTFYGQKIEWRMFGDSGGIYQLWADGSPLTARGVTGPGGTGHGYLLPIDFGSAGLHQVRLYTNHGMGILGVNIGPTDTIRPGRILPGGVLYGLGDSYSDGANGVTGLDTYPNRLAALLNTRRMFWNGEAGTGLTVDAGGSASKKDVYLARLVADTALVPAPDLVVVQGSTNDATATSGAIQTALAAVLAQVRTSWPQAFLVVTGVLQPTGSLSAGNVTNNTALRTVATGAGGADLFIDAVADGWYSGTGNAGAPAGTGNADVFLMSDTVHPSQAAADFIGEMLAGYIGAALAA